MSGDNSNSSDRPSNRIQMDVDSDSDELEFYSDGTPLPRNIPDNTSDSDLEEKEVSVKSVVEKYPGYFDQKELVEPFIASTSNQLNDDDDEFGFPEPLDLRDYFDKSDGTKSVFSVAVEDLDKSKSDDIVTTNSSISSGTVISNENTGYSLLSAHNLDEKPTEKGDGAEKGLSDSFFRELDEAETTRRVISKVKYQKNGSNWPKKRNLKLQDKSNSANNSSEIVDYAKDLEVFDSGIDHQQRQAPFWRLALNPAEQSAVLKTYSLQANRPMKSWLRLFDKFKNSELDDTDHRVLRMGQNEHERITAAYLETVHHPNGTTIRRFHEYVSPVTDGCWIFAPIRCIVNSVQNTERPINDDDLEIIQNCLIFSLWMLKKNKSLVEVFMVPSDVTIYLAEIYLLGSNIYSDRIVNFCIKVWMEHYLLLKALDNILAFPLKQPIAKLDSFAPFFHHLVGRFKEEGGGHRNFFLIIFMMASMNPVQEDSIATLKVLFNPDAEIVRQVDLTAFQVDRIISHAEKRRRDANFYYEGPMEYLWQDYSHLLKTYAICFEKEILTRERNEGLFLYAQAEIFNFVKQFKIFKRIPQSHDLDIFNMMKKTVKKLDHHKCK